MESTEDFSEIEEEVTSESSTSGGSMASENLSDITTNNSSDEYKDPMLENPPVEEEEEETAVPIESDTVVIVEELDLQLYAQQTCNARDTDTTKGNKVTTVEKSALLHITGRTSNDWYRVEHAASPTNIVYIKASLLGSNKPQQPQSDSNKTNTDNSTGKTETPSKPSQGTSTNNGNSSNVNQDVQDTINGIFDGGATGGGEGAEGGLKDWH